MTLSGELTERLSAGLAALALDLPASTQSRLLSYLELIDKWNRVYNLTAVRDRMKMLSHHVLDSLAVVPHLTGDRIVDVGSGAGLPGIPLALAMPRTHVTLLESNHKKAAFLRQAAIELKLENVEVANSRIEAWARPQAYDSVISRAFSDLTEFVTLANPLCGPEGLLYAMKGVYPYEELALLPEAFRVVSVIPLQVPGLRAERHLVVIKES
jgi:16S rRNA (guanine527-N7)-methyltransferase